MSKAYPILFGKLPRHGDFVARGLDADRRAAWDRFLTCALDTARAGLGDDFVQAHDTAPPWRFVSGPGRFGEGWRAGALAGSVDAVGRRFFLVVAVDGLSETQAADDGKRLSAAMEELTYEVFRQGWSAENLFDATRSSLILAKSSRQGQIGGACERWWVVGGADEDLIVLDHPPSDPIGYAASPFAAESAH